MGLHSGGVFVSDFIRALLYVAVGILASLALTFLIIDPRGMMLTVGL